MWPEVHGIPNLLEKILNLKSECLQCSNQKRFTRDLQVRIENIKTDSVN